MVAVVILNWNGADDTIECLASLRATKPDAVLIVVDNASTDDSVAVISASGFADEIITNHRNLGYAGGNNVGLRVALGRGADLIGVLNNDTVTESATLERLAQIPDGVAVSADIRYFDDPAKAWFLGTRIAQGRPWHLHAGEVTTETQTLSGCCIFARASVWQQVGLFDERLFLLFEDSDWSMRARERGIKLAVVPDAIVLHKVSKSFAKATRPIGRFYASRNWLIFAWRWRRRELPSALAQIARTVVRDLRAGRFAHAAIVSLAVLAAVIGQRGPAPRFIQG